MTAYLKNVCISCGPGSTSFCLDLIWLGNCFFVGVFLSGGKHEGGIFQMNIVLTPLFFRNSFDLVLVICWRSNWIAGIYLQSVFGIHVVPTSLGFCTSQTPNISHVDQAMDSDWALVPFSSHPVHPSLSTLTATCKRIMASSVLGPEANLPGKAYKELPDWLFFPFQPHPTLHPSHMCLLLFSRNPQLLSYIRFTQFLSLLASFFSLVRW